MTGKRKPVEPVEQDQDRSTTVKSSSTPALSDSGRPVISPAGTPRATDGQASGEPVPVVSLHQRLSPTPPEELGLGLAGRALWASIAEAPVLLNPTERSLLTMACQSLDLAEDAEAIVRREGLMIPWGSTTRSHPLIAKINEARGLAGRLLRSLDVPDPEPDAEPRRRRGQYRQYRGGAS